MNPLIRKIVAFFCAATLPAICLAFIGFALSQPGIGFWAFLLSFKISFGMALLGGIPMLLFLYFIGARSILHYLLASAVLGLALSAFLVGPGILSAHTLAGWPSYAAQIFIVVVISLIPGAVYWLIARPDKESPSPRPVRL